MDIQNKLAQISVKLKNKAIYIKTYKKRELFDQVIEHKIDIEKLDSDDYKFILS